MKRLCFVLSACAAAMAGVVVVPGLAGADPDPSPDTVKNLPAPPEVVQPVPVTLEEAKRRLNPHDLPNIVVTENADGTVQVSIYRLVEPNGAPPAVPSGGWAQFDEEHQ